MSYLHWFYVGTCSALLLGGAASADDQAKRPIEIADSIELRKFGIGTYDEDGPIFVSPDGKQQVFVVRSGNLKTNRNEYVLYGLTTPAKNSVPTPPQELYRLSSGGNESPIADLTWSSDSKSLVFLSDTGDSTRRVYRFWLHDRRFEAMTPPEEDIVSFAVSADGSTVAYVATSAWPSSSDAEKQAGLLLDQNDLRPLLWRDGQFDWPSAEVVVLRNGRKSTFALPFDAGGLTPSLTLSPTGKYVLVEETLARSQMPPHWKPLLDQRFSFAPNYWVLSTSTGDARRLIDATAGVGINIAATWTGDDSAIIGTKLPVGDGDPTQQYTVEVDLRDGSYTVIASELLENPEWEAAKETISGTRWGEGSKRLAFRRVGDRWIAVDARERALSVGRAFVEQGSNLPPRLVWENAKGGRTVLLDPNPQLKEIEIGESREIEVALADGKPFPATLYLPEGWRPTGAYPAVLQTYFRDSTKFTLDGNATTAGMSARYLASRGFVVAQLDHPDRFYPEISSTPNEAPVAGAVYEQVVRELIKNYGVDPARVGIFGFSRSGIVTRHMLANSNIFAAAVQSDSWFIGYAKRVLHDDAGSNLSDPIIGAAPTGEGLKVWMERAAGFNAHRITAPLLVMNFGEGATISSIEEKVVMRLAQNPTEVVLFPSAVHNPVKPAERFAVQSRYVDWFRFWLQDYEGEDPKKADQYQRWRKLREQRDAKRLSLS